MVGKLFVKRMLFLLRQKEFRSVLNSNVKLAQDFLAVKALLCKSLKGTDLSFVHAGGTIIKKDLAPGEVLRVDTGCLVAMTKDVDYNIEMVKGVKTALFGGEGLFFATLRGPGSVWIQSLPFSRLASRVFAAAPHSGGSKDEGSIAKGLFDMFGGK